MTTLLIAVFLIGWMAAAVVGTATESCIRIISEFKKKGYLRTSGKKIGIANEKELQDLIDGF